MSTPPLFSTNPWSNQLIVFYHGTLLSDAPAIAAKVDINIGRPHTDFGRFFYTTTILRQAKSWA